MIIKLRFSTWMTCTTLNLNISLIYMADLGHALRRSMTYNWIYHLMVPVYINEKLIIDKWKIDYW